MANVAGAAVTYDREFSPLEGMVSSPEAEFRQEICLNGKWQFQPVEVPADWEYGQGIPPELSMPSDKWSETPIRIPSPWNVNAYGAGRNVGVGTDKPYWPSSVTFPSYPQSWDGIRMGWLTRRFEIPKDWINQRILLHFGAVAGQCKVYLNGQLAGEHFDRFMPFDLDITDLVEKDGSNELLVGVRHDKLYEKTHPNYPHQRAVFAPGSNLDDIVGIWQDVFLVAVPPVHVTDAFVQPWVDRNELIIETTVRNDAETAQIITIGGTVSPWRNEAGTGVVSAPEPKWSLGEALLHIAPVQMDVEAGASETIRLKVNPNQKLKLWSPDAPNLYGAILDVRSNNKTIDQYYQRFGWRQFTIDGKDLLLNGDKLQVLADILHPFGVFIHTRRHAWAWYSMIKDVGGNGVRLHAQPWPAYYLDLADEMGLVVLDETALFGSSLRLNFTEPAAWERYAEHYDALVLRDRNHPSVFGWSFGNELFAIFDYNKFSHEDSENAYAELEKLSRRSLKLDPTRTWISCDGDTNLRGTLPVWSKHFGHGLFIDQLPTDLNIPLMVGESGGTYYAKPGQMAEFNGERAYESYAGRNEALAIDSYQNIVQMALPYLAYYSASELSWFGIEHLPIGYNTFSRLPNHQDGIFFGPFEEGRPGMQPERLVPYSTTFNPGYDPSLPLYKPLAMFDAMKAALAPGGPEPCAWDHYPEQQTRPGNKLVPSIRAVAFMGDRSGEFYRTLDGYGVPFSDSADKVSMAMVDGETVTLQMVQQSHLALKRMVEQGGTLWICVRQAGTDMTAVNKLLPAPAVLGYRSATSLARASQHAWVDSMSLPDLYFAESATQPEILQCGIAGDFARQGTVLLKASNVDWSQFFNSEVIKCSAVVAYEQVNKGPDAALVEMTTGKGRVVISSIDYGTADPAYVNLWRMLLENAGVKLEAVQNGWQLPIAPVHRMEWRYTTSTPAVGWEKVAFDDSAWKSGKAGFGGPVPAAVPTTQWNSDDIWLRARFDAAIDTLGEYSLIIHHDEDVEVWLNGISVFSEIGFLTDYKSIKLSETAVASLMPTGNILAIHCKQSAGGQYVDAGIIKAESLKGGASGKEHNLLLDGPKN